ncbi:hypothetical protein CEXT_43741 [Caerostris extrusa]|uniref:Uncharacterized protein n=1 Tax=Caerostris extrusa TaxID=172846 RepID=A0AAV4WZQ5_CAEEX|nr:hypothetical protein CEXT_43741 [Caerostris extrusa]
MELSEGLIYESYLLHVFLKEVVAELSTQACLGVRFAYLGVPGSVSRGDSIWLDCGYDLKETSYTRSNGTKTTWSFTDSCPVISHLLRCTV